MTATIVIPVLDGLVFQHFSTASKFKVYTIENDVVTAAEVCESGGGCGGHCH